MSELNEIEVKVLSYFLECGGASKAEVMRDLFVSDAQFVHAVKGLRHGGFNIVYDGSLNRYHIGSLRDVSGVEQLLVDEIQRLDLSDYDIGVIIKNLQSINPRKYVPKEIKVPDYSLTFGLFSDAHIGHSKFRPDVLHHAVESWRKRDIEHVLNCGDTIEGMSNREGHIYELAQIGWSAQMDEFVNQFQQFEDYGMKVYSVEAETSHSGWTKIRSNQGVETGVELDRRSKAYEFVGYNAQDVVFRFDGFPLNVRLFHPGGRSSYAISYKFQKRLESLGGGSKPHIAAQGHFHKSNYMFYRNVHAVDAACLQDQTIFMERIGTPAHVGYWTLNAEIEVTDNGDWKKPPLTIRRFSQEFTAFYD